MNKEQVYDTKISPLVNQIYKICEEHGIEMLANFFIQTDEQPLLQSTTSIPSGAGTKSMSHLLALLIIAPNVDPDECDPHELQ